MGHTPTQTSAAPTNAVAATTTTLVAQVIGRIPWVPVIAVVLLVLVAGSSLVCVGRATAMLHDAQTAATQAALYRTLDDVVRDETEVIGAPSLADTRAYDYATDRSRFETTFYTLADHDAASYALLDSHSRLLHDCQTWLPQEQATPDDSAVRQKVAVLWLTARTLHTTIGAQTAHFQAAADAATDAAATQLGEGFWVIFGLLVVTLGILSATTRFVLRFVVQPLHYLNTQLLGLLWSQTEHLTQQLNLLRAQISVDEQRFAAASHDLKAPLGNIKALTEVTLLTHPHLADAVQKNFTRIALVADQGAALVSESLAKRPIQPQRETVRLGALVDKVLQLVDVRNFTVRTEIELAEATLDPQRIEHLLLNLVSNARKFSAGAIRVGTRLTVTPGTVNELATEIWVWNDGVTIAPDKRTEIFKPGYQTEAGKQKGGHGLGLSIVKTIAEEHHGRVLVESHERIGTTFRVLLPCPTPQDTTTGEQALCA